MVNLSLTAAATAAAAGVAAQWTSPEVLPAKEMSGAGDWAGAFQQAQSFVAELTIEEKVNLTTGQGTMSRCLGNTGAVTRFGFPGLCLHDSPAGIRLTDLVSVFPSGMNAAATWDRDLIRLRGEELGAEARGKGINVLLAPGMNLARVPAGGRNWEAGGGDPYLTGVAAAETIKGVQSQGVIGCAKHWVGNEQERHRNGYSANIDDRAMHEVYQWPFADSVQSGVASIMCSYNKVNQTSACENSKVLNGLLKEELNFQGFVTSDWVAIYDEGSAPALAGLDMNMPGIISWENINATQNPAEESNSLWGANLVELVRNGTVPESRLNDMVTRTMAAYYKLGQDNSYPDLNFDYGNPDQEATNSHVDVRANHADLIRRIGGASSVLLKNEASSLPLRDDSVGSIGVFGVDAGPDPNGLNACVDHACSNGTLAIGWGSGTANFTYLVDPLQGIQSYADTKGLEVKSVLNNDFERIEKVAQSSDTCLAFANSDSGENYLVVDGNEGDRNNLTLWHEGDKVIQTVADACENTIVVLHTVGQVDMEAWIEHPNVKAVIWAGLPGQESGNAITDVLFGMVNPSARLPFTMARQRSDYPADILYDSEDETPQITYEESLLIDYRHFDQNDIEPRFEFGFGLSYSNFTYSELQVSSLSNSGEVSQSDNGGLWNPALSVSFGVTNANGPDGFEVSQLYLSFPEGSGEPPKVLRGFERTWLSAGQTLEVKTELTNKDLSIWDVTSQSWVQQEGTYTISVGSSSRNLPLQQQFSL